MHISFTYEHMFKRICFSFKVTLQNFLNTAFETFALEHLYWVNIVISFTIFLNKEDWALERFPGLNRQS